MAQSGSVKMVVVECEKLLAKLEKAYPNLGKIALSLGTGIVSAGTGYTLGHLAGTAKSHDKNENDHTVHYHE